jgi:hypothetical protein
MDTKAMLIGYVNDMLAVENELHAAFRRQKKDPTVAEFTPAADWISRTEGLIDRHLAALKRCLGELGSDESVVKKTVGAVTGAVAGWYDKLRSEKVSRMLRDDYAAISFALVSYEMLYTTAVAVGNGQVATLALEHYRDLTPLAVQLSDVLPQVLIDELEHDEKLAVADTATDDVVTSIREAWTRAS